MTIRSTLSNLLSPLEARGSQPQDVFSALQREIDQVFDNFGRALPLPALRAAQAMPRAELVRRNGQIELKADLPGVDPKDIQLAVEGDTITLHAERKDKREAGEGETRMTEISYGAIDRSFTVPFPIDAATIKAEFRNGELNVTIPVPAGAVPERKVVPIKAS